MQTNTPPIDPLETHRHEAVQLLKALANEHRLAILCLLREGEQSVTLLGQQLPLSQSALSQHLAWLRKEHIVVARRRAQTVFYALANDNAERLIQTLHHLYCPTESRKSEQQD